MASLVITLSYSLIPVSGFFAGGATATGAFFFFLFSLLDCAFDTIGAIINALKADKMRIFFI